MTVEVSREPGKRPKVAVFSGTKFSTSTLLCDRVLDLLQPKNWHRLPASTRDWFQIQRERSKLPGRSRLLVECFTHARMEFTCIYGFAGRNAHQTLGLLLTQRMERTGLQPLGMIASDYALMIWGLKRISDLSALLSADGLREGLETWLAGNAVMKRTFRGVATVAGLIERMHPGKRRTGRQVTFSTDILYDTLRKHDPDHLLLKVTRGEAMRGLVDFARIEEMITRIGGRFDYVQAPGVTPFAALSCSRWAAFQSRGRPRKGCCSKRPSVFFHKPLARLPASVRRVKCQQSDTSSTFSASAWSLLARAPCSGPAKGCLRWPTSTLASRSASPGQGWDSFPRMNPRIRCSHWKATS